MAVTSAWEDNMNIHFLLLFKLLLVAIATITSALIWFIKARDCANRSSREIKFSFWLSCLTLILGSWIFGAMIGVIPPPRWPHYNVNVQYIYSRFHPDGTRAVFIKAVVQEREVWRYHSVDFGRPEIFWGKEPALVWHKIFLCQSDRFGQNPQVVREVPIELLTCPTYKPADYYGHTGLWSGIIGFDYSWFQNKAVFGLLRETNSVGLLDLDTGSWFAHNVYDPHRPAWGGAKHPASVQFIEHGSVILASASENVLVIISLDGKETVRNIEAEILANGPADMNWRNLERHDFVTGPVWNEEQKLISVTGSSAYLLFDTNLIFRQAVPLKAVIRSHKDIWNQYGWVIERNNSYRNMTRDFKLMSHTLKEKTIRPDEASELW